MYLANHHAAFAYQGTLTILAFITLTQTFIRTSPYAHLLPSISTLPLHPITFVRDTISVIGLHIDYTTQKTNESREQKILDAQKRRLYRRAHGMEDLNAAEDQGIDVRGLVPWDDGLTNKERESGGRAVVVTGRDVIEMGGQVGDDVNEFARRLKTQKETAASGGEREEAGESTSPGEEVQQQPEQQRQKRKRKIWLGIW